jgi:RHS repeat-associated protein
VKRITAGVLTRILRRRISRTPCSPIRRRPKSPGPRFEALESRDPTGNLVGGLVAAALGGQLFEPVELMARAVGDVALLGGAVPHGAQAVDLSVGTTQTFSALPAADSSIGLTRGQATNSQVDSGGAGRTKGLGNGGVSIALPTSGLADDSLWVGTAPSDFFGELPASVPPGLTDSAPWTGAGIGVPSASSSSSGGMNGTAVGIGGPVGESSGNAAFAPPASTDAMGTTNTTQTAANISVLSATRVPLGLPAPVAGNSGGTPQATAPPTANISGGSGPISAANTSISSGSPAAAAAPPSPPVPPSLVTGSDGGGTATVKVLDPATGQVKLSFAPYGNNFTGGVRVAAADLNADGVADVITGPGHGGGSQVKVFDGKTGKAFKGTLGSFNAFAAGASDGVFVAAGDVNGDGKPDIIVGTEAGASSPAVKVFNGANGALLATVQLGADFGGGARVAAGDVNGDGKADIIAAAGPGGPPRVEVFDASNRAAIYDFFASEPYSSDGVYIAAADINGDGKADIIAGDGGSQPEVRVFSGSDLTSLLTFAALDSAFTGGVRVGVTDANGDGQPDIVAAGGPGGGEVRLFDGRTDAQISSTSPYGTSFHDGTFAAGTPGSKPSAITPLTVPPVVTITGSPGSIVEGSGTQGVFTITRDNTSGYLTVFIAIGGTATPGDDWLPYIFGQANFIPGEATITKVFTSVDDCIFENTETVVATIQQMPDNSYTVGNPGSATIAIKDVGPPSLVPEPQNGLVQEAPGLDVTPMMLSPSGVRYADGAAQITLPDFIPDDSCSCSTDPLGLRRDWSGGAFVPDGTFGNGVVALQLPYLLQNCEGFIAAVTAGTSARVFDRIGPTQYVPRFFLQEQLARDPNTGEFALADTEGNVFDFYGFGSGVPALQRGQLKTLTDAGGNVTTVTYNTDGTPAELSWAVTTGGVTTTESFLFGYITNPQDPNYRKSSSAQLRRKVGNGSWETVRTVEYTYYDGTDNGDVGDLKTTVVKDASGVPINTSYYRYYITGSSNPTPSLKYVFGPDSLERLKAAFPTTWQTASDADVAPYADLQLGALDSGQHEGSVVVQGKGCSACTGGLGTYTYSYGTSAFADGYNTWRTKTTETLPDGNQNIVYTNFAGQVMLSVYKDTTTGQQWETYYRYDSAGRLLLKADPSAVSGYDDTRPDLLNNQSGNYQYLRDSAGLIETNSYYSGPDTATQGQAGSVAGYLNQTAVQRGELGASVLQSTTQYFKLITVSGAVIAPVANQTVYRNTDGSGAETRAYSYTYFPGTRPQSVTVTYPTVSAAQNGPGTADSETTYFDVYGRPVWSKDGDGFITYRSYDATGAVLKTITDVDTTRTSDFTGLPSGWTTPTGGGLHLITEYEVDALGRVTKETSNAGNITYTVYNDANHEVRVYQGWDSSTNTPTRPTMVQRHDRANNYTEALTMTATPTVSAGRPTGAEAISGVQTLKRSAMNAAGQVTDVYEYFNLGGLSYGTALVLTGATENTNYYRTRYQYDHRGRLERTQTPSSTVYRTVYDGQGRAVSQWVGTNDTPGSGYWSPTNNTSPSNMVMVKEYTYDLGGAGDGNLTKAIQHPGGGAADRETDWFYDWRDRLVASKGGVQGTEDTTTHRPIIYLTYDNLGAVTRSQQYDGDGVTVTDGNSDGVPDAPSSSLLRAQADAAYDEQGRAYRTTVYSVNASTGVVSSTGLVTNNYFDHRGDAVKASVPGGLVTKDTYDGAGRLTVEYTTDGGGDTSWADALNVTGDAVLEQTETQYDADGNAILVTTRQRFHDETATGALGDPNTGPKARASYAAAYYDAADRLIHSVAVGTNGGTAYTRPPTVPDRSDTVLVMDYDYDPAGWLETTTDPKGIVSKTFYDNLGRVTKTIENYVDGAPSDADDKTVEYTYDPSGGVKTLKVDLPGSGQQTTQWVYGVTGAQYSNDILKEVDYPDPSTGAPSLTDKDQYTVNALGQVVTATDRNGNVHTYTYDVVRRPTSDAVTTLGAGVDGSARRIDVAYDTQGNPYLITRYDAATGGNIVNQVQRSFNGLGQLTKEYQSHSGAVNTSTTPNVQYAYTEMAGGANHSRLTSITYPNNKVLTYNYTSSLNDSISRLSSLSDGTGTLESYDYLGLGTVVRRAHSQPGVDLTYIKQTGESNGDAGDQYTGLDRFGRVVDQRWLKTSTGTATDRLQYGYDRDGNRTYRDNLVNAAFGEVYSYDNLNQLSSFQRGTLNANKNGIVGTASRSQSWDFDALGNWDSVTADGTTQTRTANAQNEITSVSGAATPTYDANGNLTTDETGKQFIYDAWDRLVKVKDPSNNVIASYQYDGLGRRATETKSGTTREFYYSEQWQVLEERVNGQAQIQYVWSPVYLDAIVLRDRDANGDGTLEERLWAVQDPHFNVTALLDGSGNVVERYAYDPFGAITVYDISWNVRAGGSSYGMVYLFQGLRFDKDTGLYDARNRFLGPTLGRWLQEDPLSFAAGDSNFYRALGNRPISAMDPTGLEIDGFDPEKKPPEFSCPAALEGDPADRTDARKRTKTDSKGNVCNIRCWYGEYFYAQLILNPTGKRKVETFGKCRYDSGVNIWVFEEGQNGFAKILWFNIGPDGQGKATREGRAEREKNAGVIREALGKCKAGAKNLTPKEQAEAIQGCLQKKALSIQPLPSRPNSKDIPTECVMYSWPEGKVYRLFITEGLKMEWRDDTDHTPFKPPLKEPTGDR